ncbi:hypothetical protein GALMADRAFT_1122341 [Galerina marginata CBS 339.88]|uniref:F-box domain-containing protein n=1 Tax=Galerina marginata (strain CBS 339.88) TaxID=685588 RepID=A0A067TD12_GALM3|nr:hypothetical protein GALMADRAFT_1122341 [Galerina marginata CBS 339.88]
MSQSGSSQSSSSNSTAPVPYSREGILAAVRAESRERADALLEWLQASDNLHRRLIVGSKYSLGQHQSTPILKLHDDLLLRVFMLNADLLPVEVTDLDDDCGERDALNVTRGTSQVCKQWRELTINSPSLWGRCVDLKRLNQQEPHWRNEVMRRTGASFLHVRGSIVSLQLGIFFLDLLDTSWERIRALEVSLERFDAIITDPRWAVLQRPAPALQIFSLSLDSVVPNILPTPEAPIFGGHASLAKLVLSGCAGVLFKIPSSQFFQIRHLAIYGSFTIPELFKALSNMSRLEYLQVHQNPRTDTTPLTLPHIIFPRLLRLSLNSTLDSCLTMLEHMTVAPGSGLILYCPDEGGIQIENSTDRLSTVLCPYTQSFFDSHIVSKLSMKLTKDNFLFDCDADSSISRSPPRLFFSTESGPRRRLHPRIYDAIFAVFSSCQSIDVSDLFISLSPCDYTPASAGSMSFISSFSSVETLSTTAEFLDILLAKSNDKCLFLPLLKTVKYMSNTRDTTALDTIKNFLLQRQEAGVPVQLLIIEISRPPSVEARQLFEMFSGLRVIWVTFGRWSRRTWDQKDAEFYARLTRKVSNIKPFEF